MIELELGVREWAAIFLAASIIFDVAAWRTFGVSAARSALDPPLES